MQRAHYHSKPQKAKDMSIFSSIFAGKGQEGGDGTTPKSQETKSDDASVDTVKNIDAADGADGKGTQSSDQTESTATTGQEAAEVQAAAEAQPEYLADWTGGTTFTNAINNGDHTIAEYMADYNKYAGANGVQPLDIFEMMNAIQARDVNKSVAQNQADEKKLARRERWQSIGNILAHLGNFVGTLVGAPSQTIESGTELTKRQQVLRDKTMQERNAYNQNLLAQIWKDRADQRAAEKNNADIGLIRQRIEALQNDNERKNAKNEADIALAGARQQQAEEAAQYSRERAATESATRDAKVKNINASTNAHNASAAASRARAAASNATAYGNNYKANRHKIWAENKRKHPNDFKQFMEDNNIHSWDKKQWSSELIDQFNAWIGDKYENRGADGGGGGASDLLD